MILMKKSDKSYEYLVRWKDGEGEDTWEPKENFDDMEVVKRYWKQVKAGKIVLPKRRGPRRKKKSRKILDL